MYAIVDIETTGGYAANNAITEVAIVLHNGREVEGRYQTLINPLQKIPLYISALTGINQQMVAEAPLFDQVAGRIARLLEGRVFVAHNVNFDYSFLKHHLQLAGYELNCRKLCTVRLGRHVIPGLPSYSLGNLCRHLDIPVYNRHRAGGDANATVMLFEHLLRSGGADCVEKFLKRHAREQSLPPNLPKEQVDQLPYTPGVYYFHDQKGKVVYVGKAKNLKHRVSSHFTHNGTGKQRQEFLRTIHHISYQSCGTELMAAILESIEIRRLWPAFNVSQKRFMPVYGLYCFEDRKGYLRLVIEKKKKQLPSLYTFNLFLDGHNRLHKLIREFNLDSRLCFVDKSAVVEVQSGATISIDPPDIYNERVRLALQSLQQQLPTYAVVDEGRRPGEQSFILMEQGRFCGMGYVPTDVSISSTEELKTYATIYPESDYIRSMISQYVQKWPAKKKEYNPAKQ
ncbi:MAG TPA: exonuclease domain-containing protein [Chitinophagaceae bacterium]|nr:exonuclease domain-containing protein [Chitinophagaceae bacterium]